MLSLFDTHDMRRVVLFTYGVSFQTKSSIFFFPFLPNISPFFFSFVSCFVFHVLLHLTPPSHPILHSYRRTLSPPDSDGHTYIHAYIPWDVIHSTLGHFFFYLYPYLQHPSYPSIFSTYYHNTQRFSHKSRLSCNFYLLFSVFRFGPEVRTCSRSRC
jgi:hypothetical protein